MENLESANIDFTSVKGIKESTNGILAMLVAPHLGEEQKAQIRGYDEKLDAILAIGAFVPGATDMINEQV